VRRLKRFVRDQSLPLVMFGIFAATLIGLAFAGWGSYNGDQAGHGEPPIPLTEYLGTPAFGEAVFENWESEFLQMGAYILLTALLVSRGSAESKEPGAGRTPEADPRAPRHTGKAPWPVRRGGLARVLYEHSLTIALFALFIGSFALHAVTGAAAFSQEQVEHGERAVSVVDYLATSRFWFESLQNWQSEFLSVGALIVLSIFLRQKGSPESKPVAASHRETGG
jgi:hypothetical protein